MNNARIFVSSTCYDLSAVREDLRAFITDLGHVAVLSEYNSFPINPQESAIDNCRKNVREHTDILVLIIGGRRGYVEAETGKSITNLEYDTAMQAGIPCFVFIKKEVLTLLPHWKKNGNGDFTPDVDSPDVFRFVESIRSANRWTFAFERTEDIKSVLSLQWSNLFRELLGRARKGTLDPLKEFELESRKAERIAREKPLHWEPLLTAELLKDKLANVRKRYDRLLGGFVPIKRRPIGKKEFADAMLHYTSDITSIADSLQKQITIALNASWGPVGQPGSPIDIKQGVDQVISLCDALYDCEECLIAMQPPGMLEPARKALVGVTASVLADLERYPDILLAPFADGATPVGKVDFTLVLSAPNLEPFHREMKNLSRISASLC